MNWDNLRIFLALARCGSVRGASKQLLINHSTVSRRITAFETSLGVRLFERLASGYVLTEAGQALMPSAVRIEEETFKIERQLMGKDTELEGIIRFTLPDLLLTHLLAQDLVDFSNLYPEIHLEILTSYEAFNLHRREADVALRIVQNPPQGYLFKKKVIQFNSAVYASKKYLETVPKEDWRWIGRSSQSKVADWVKTSPFPDLPVYHAVHPVPIQIELAKRGLGLLIIACFAGDTESDLVRVTPEVMPGYWLWLLTHEDLYQTQRIKLFIDFLEARLLQKKELIQGFK